MFAKVSIFGRFRTFGKVFSMLLSFNLISLVVRNIYRSFLINGDKLREKQIKLDQDRLEEDKERGNRRKNIRFLIIAFLIWIFCVLSIELMIKWNDITGVYSLATVGQLIPLIIGSTGFITVYEAWDLSPAVDFLEKSIEAKRRGIEKANSRG